MLATERHQKIQKHVRPDAELEKVGRSPGAGRERQPATTRAWVLIWPGKCCHECLKLVARLSVTRVVHCNRRVQRAFTSSLMSGSGYFCGRGGFDAGSFGGVMQGGRRAAGDSRKGQQRSGSSPSVGFVRSFFVSRSWRSPGMSHRSFGSAIPRSEAVGGCARCRPRISRSGRNAFLNFANVVNPGAVRWATTIT